MAWVKFVREGIEIEVNAGMSVLEAEIRAGLRPDAPCGGLGKCGKCLVKIDGEVVKACQVRICEGETCVVETLDRSVLHLAAIQAKTRGFIILIQKNW